MAVDPGEDPRKPVGGDLILPVAAVAFTIYYFSTIWNSPWEAQVAAFLVGTVLLFLIGILFFRVVRDLVAGSARWSFEPLYGPRWVLPHRAILIALTAGYLLALDYLGFTLTSFLFLFLGMSVLSDAHGESRRFVKFATISATLSLTGWLVFIVAFDARFPDGPFETLMARLLSQ